MDANMIPGEVTAESLAAAELASAEALLADFEITGDETTYEEPEGLDEGVEEELVNAESTEDIPGSADPAIEGLADGDAAVLEAEIAKSEIYAEQPAGEVVTEAPAPAAKEKAAKTPKEKKERVSRDLSTIDAKAFVLINGWDGDLEANKAAVIASRPGQKKIAEKFDNLIASLAAGKQPSVYVMACFEALAAKGEVTQGDLVAALKAYAKKTGSGTYSEGTTRSQAGQCMALFNVVNIATRTGQTLKLNPDSTFAAALKGMLAAPAPASA